MLCSGRKTKDIALTQNQSEQRKYRTNRLYLPDNLLGRANQMPCRASQCVAEGRSCLSKTFLLIIQIARVSEASLDINKEDRI